MTGNRLRAGSVTSVYIVSALTQVSRSVLPSGYRRRSLEVQQSEIGADRSPISSADVKNLWSCVSSHPQVVMLK
jgi:hypothetical protein